MNEQQETIAPILDITAGEMLKNARTTGRRKREISTIAKLLCIKEEFLAALEEGNYRVIPEDVYILGFARSYAVELGLNPDEVILKLKKELGILKEEAEEVEEPVAAVQKQPIKIDKETILKWCKTAISFVKKYWIWFASGFAALIFVIILSLLIFGGSSESKTNEVVTVEETTAAVVIKEPDFRYPVHEQFETKNRKESRVVLQAEKESWVKIEDARGNSVFSRVLIPGDVYYMPASDKLKATFGNVGAIDVWVDGQLIKKLGPANTKKTGISMAPDALKSVGLAD
jgi:hypothetical protein